MHIWNTILSLALAGHFVYHLVAMVGVTASLWHSYKVHKHSWWKLVLAVLWLAISLIMVYHSFIETC